MGEEGRIALLERRTDQLSQRVEELEARLAPAPRPAPPPVQWRPEAPPERPRGAASNVARSSTPPPAPQRPVRGSVPVPPKRPSVPVNDPLLRAMGSLRTRVSGATFEDLVAGRVLAWAGGAAVFVGLILLFAVAVSRGWVGEAERTLLGGLASLGLAAAGAWLHERRGRTDAAMAATSAGIAGLFAVSVVASRVYELVPAAGGLAIALGTGAAATAIALRWRSRGIATLGVLGGLGAPLLVGAPAGGSTTVTLFVAAAAAVAICVHQRWDWLGLAAFAVATPQWLAGLSEADADGATTIATLTAFGALFAVAAVGHDLRRGAAKSESGEAPAPRAASLLLLALSAFVTAGAGWSVVEEAAGEGAANIWIAVVAVAHIAGGVALLRTPRASRPLAIATLALGVVVADVAVAQALSGVALAFAWTGAIGGFAVLGRRMRRAGVLDEVALGTGLGTHVALALLHVLVVDAPPESVQAGEASAIAAVSVASLAAACFASSALLERRIVWRDLLNALGLAALAYLAATALDGAALAVAWALEAAALAAIARRAARGAVGGAARDASGRELTLWTSERAERVAGAALPLQIALAFIGAVVLTAPLDAITDGVADLGAAVVSLLAVAGAAFAGGLAGRARGVADGDPGWRVVLDATGVAALAWLAVVTLDGAVLVTVLAAGAALLAEIGRRMGDKPALAGAAAVLAGAIAHVVVIEAQPMAIVDNAPDTVAAIVALLAVAAAAFAAGRADDTPDWRVSLDAIGVAALAWLAIVTLDGAVLVAVLAAGAAVLAEIARRTDDQPALAGAAALLAGALGHALAIEAPPIALVDGVASVGAAALALGPCILAACALARAERRAIPVAAALALYLPSIILVTEAGAGERAQMLLSALWAGVGVAALIAGLVRDIAPLRTGALVLIGIALAKVFLYDLATLTAMARVASFLALGLLLLAGAFAWQRIRPRPLPDLREAPPGART